MTGLPLWQQLAGVLTAAALVLVWAILARRARQAPGRHRADQVVPRPDVFDQVLMLAAVAPEPELEPVDDWTADLPTAELPVVRHTSPSETLRGQCELDSPIFMEMALPLGYDPVRGFDALFNERSVAA